VQRDVVRDAGGLQRKIECGTITMPPPTPSSPAMRPPTAPAATSAAITGNQLAYASISSGSSWITAAILRRVGYRTIARPGAL